MRSSKCVFSSATALHRIFVAPIELQTRVQFRGLSAATLQLRSRPHTLSNARISSGSQRRHVSLHRAEKARLPRDDEIEAWSVTLVDAEGKLTEPQPTRQILDSIDRKISTLVMVVPGEAGVPPICKIRDKKQMREAEKAKVKAARGSGTTQKTMELNWAIGKNDLGHRMDKLKGWMEKGWKVEVVLAGKRKGKKATEEEAEALVAHIRGIMNEVGGRENKVVEGKILGQMTLYLEGKKGGKTANKTVDGNGAENTAEATTAADAQNDAGNEESASSIVDDGSQNGTVGTGSEKDVKSEKEDETEEGFKEGEEEDGIESGDKTEPEKLAELRERRRRRNSGWEMPQREG
ncbi:uncharacterized protein RAG0_05278 [Rhynchosporium agropyri]|uniref:Translation initiation factor 3 N-terminal domain-containing protein n=1 Tax=Rhynchosporium agropyri TaxID=914238 RepID=A0A1E1KCK4_9HELO|nr:uncharacterized protein RAG0_05278 [Rhynchosporium agropyri]